MSAAGIARCHPRVPAMFVRPFAALLLAALALPAAEVDARLARHGLNDLKLYSGATHHALLALQPFVKALLDAPAPPIDDGDCLGDPSLAQDTGPLKLVAA